VSLDCERLVKRAKTRKSNLKSRPFESVQKKLLEIDEKRPN